MSARKEAPTKVCKTCGKVFSKPPHRSMKSWATAEYCCRSCARKKGVEEVYPPEWTEELRESIRQRDEYTCQLCGTTKGGEGFPIHHIDYNKKHCTPDNLVTLCVRCHGRTRTRRAFWQRYFEVAMKKKLKAWAELKRAM